MKILSTSESTESNLYTRQLYDSLSPLCSHAASLHEFFESDHSYDIIHIQWVSELCGWREPNKETLDRIKKSLERWSATAKIVITRHNRIRHYEEHNPVFQELNELVYSFANGVIHLGETSLRELESKMLPQACLHTVIPHGDYAIFGTQVESVQARKALNIPKDKVVVLVFGNIRHTEEQELVLRCASHASKLNLYFLVPSWTNRYEPERTHSNSVQGDLLQHFRIENRFVSRDEVPTYLGASDVVMIPRVRALNSGNVALGFTFSKVVLGPDSGNIGEILRETGNPCFDPFSKSSISDAMQHALALLHTNKGECNKRFAEQHMQWGFVAEQHMKFYSQVLG